MSNQSPVFDHGDWTTETGFAAASLTLIFVGYEEDELDDARAVIHNMARYEWGRGAVRVATGTWADILEYRVKPGEIAVAYPALGAATPGSAPPGVRVVRNRQLQAVLTADTPSEVTQWLALPTRDDLAGLAAMFDGFDADTPLPSTSAPATFKARRWVLVGAAVTAAIAVATASSRTSGRSARSTSRRP
jgi:hypothetical protein